MYACPCISSGRGGIRLRPIRHIILAHLKKQSLKNFFEFQTQLLNILGIHQKHLRISPKTLENPKQFSDCLRHCLDILRTYLEMARHSKNFPNQYWNFENAFQRHPGRCNTNNYRISPETYWNYYFLIIILEFLRTIFNWPGKPLEFPTKLYKQLWECLVTILESLRTYLETLKHIGNSKTLIYNHFGYISEKL